jgi:hypothetical protein
MRPLRPDANTVGVSVLRPLRPTRPDDGPRPAWRTTAAIVAGLVFIALPAAAAERYVGSVGSFLLFEVSFAGMLASALPRPRSYAFTFLAVLLFIGFWVKFNLHTVFDYGYQEPIGSFDDSGADWDAALLMASCGAIGVTLARLLVLKSKTWLRSRCPAVNRARVPDWFAEHRKAVWISTIAGGVSLHIANMAFAFYTIGVDPHVLLPAHGNVIAGWLVKLGLALWIATLVGSELRLARARPDSVFIAPIAEGALASVSALSRGIYLFHAIPYLVALLNRSAQPLRDVGRRRLAVLAVVATAGFVVSLGAVSVLRLLIYPTAGMAQGPRSAAVRDPSAALPAVTESGSRFDAKHVSFAVRQVRGLFIDRWNGMEGVMAVSAYDELGGTLLIDAVKEDPARGQDSIYQRISGADAVYQQSGGYTFLTLPGIVGVLGYAGSAGVVIGGMALLTLLAVGIEGAFRFLVDNRFVASLAGFAIASELTQANFPYLLATFFVLLVLSLGAIALATLGASGPAAWRRRRARSAA